MVQRYFLFCLALAAHGQPASFSPAITSYIANTSVHVRDVTTDCEGNMIFVGGTNSTAFTVTAGSAGGSYHGGNCDIFVVKKNPQGQAVFSTLFGGSQYDRAYAVETDDLGFIYVAGRAGNGMPVSSCAVQPVFAGDNVPNPAYGVQDGFILKLTPDGSTIVWCTYLGCSGRGFIRDIDVDSQGNVWAGFSVVNSSFPWITAGAAQTSVTATYNSALVKLSAHGQNVLYGTYVSDNANTEITPPSVRVDHQDNVVMVSGGANANIPVTPGAYQPLPAGGTDFVLSKFTAQGALVYCTFLGGNGLDTVETHGLEIDSQGNAIVAAFTQSTNFPLVSGGYQSALSGTNDGIIAKLSADGVTLLASTYLGGNNIDGIEGVGIDVFDNIYVSGNTSSVNFPITPGAMQTVKGAAGDGFMAVLSPDLDTLVYSTFVGGNSGDQLRSCHVDAFGNFLAGGSSQSNNLPLVNAFDTSLTGTLTGMAVKLTPDVPTVPTQLCTITNIFTDPCQLSVGNQERENVLLYPNPASSEVFYRLDTGMSIPATLEVFDQSGRLVISHRVETIEGILELHNLSAGVYLLKVTNQSGAFRLVKQ